MRCLGLLASIGLVIRLKQFQFSFLVSEVSICRPFKGLSCQLVTLCHPGVTYIFNFWHSVTLALTHERQSDRMSEIKKVR